MIIVYYGKFFSFFKDTDQGIAQVEEAEERLVGVR